MSRVFVIPKEGWTGLSIPLLVWQRLRPYDLQYFSWNFQIMSPVYSSNIQHELLNRITGGGLSATYRFTRSVSIFSPKMVSVDITFTNNTENPIGGIRLGEKVWSLFYLETRHPAILDGYLAIWRVDQPLELWGIFGKHFLNPRYSDKTLGMMLNPTEQKWQITCLQTVLWPMVRHYALMYGFHMLPNLLKALLESHVAFVYKEAFVYKQRPPGSIRGHFNWFRGVWKPYIRA